MKSRGRIASWLKVLGPGFITGAADDDPSGIGTYSQTGAQFGYSQLWTMLFCLPLMIAIQEMCGRIGLVTGQGLAAVIKQNYSRKVLGFCVVILLITNAINIGADLGAMAAAANLLAGGPFWVWVIGITIFTLALEIFVAYHHYAKVLKYFALSLLAYVITLFVVKQPWGLILKSTLIPHVEFTRDYLLNIVAIIGTTISPYLFFWQANQEVEEAVDQHRAKGLDDVTTPRAQGHLRRVRLDTIAGMSFSNFIAFFIIATTASTLGANGVKNIETAEDAAKALQPLAGNFAFALFSLGIIGTGLLAVPVLAGSAAYAVAEAVGWPAGLGKRLRQARGFYGVITLATLLGLVVNFTSIAPFKLLYYTAVLNGMTAPPLMVLILLISNNRRIMGDFCNGRLGNILGWTITVVMAAAAAALLISLVV